jgi:hypothetical protein
MRRDCTVHPAAFAATHSGRIHHDLAGNRVDLLRRGAIECIMCTSHATSVCNRQVTGDAQQRIARNG